jgi:hypothetical protein
MIGFRIVQDECRIPKRLNNNSSRRRRSADLQEIMEGDMKLFRNDDLEQWIVSKECELMECYSKNRAILTIIKRFSFLIKQ